MNLHVSVPFTTIPLLASASMGVVVCGFALVARQEGTSNNLPKDSEFPSAILVFRHLRSDSDSTPPSD